MMESKNNQKAVIREKELKPREKRSLLIPVFGLLTLVFTAALLSAFIFTYSSVQHLSDQDGDLKEQIQQLRLKILALKEDIGDESLDEHKSDQFTEKENEQPHNSGQSRKRQIQAVGFMSAILKAQEQIFERYCVDHNATCPKGPDGVMGVQGENGTDGVVVGNVTQGTVGPAGPQGDQGEPGLPGVKGPTGDKGENGDTGSKGPIGVQGQQGPDGENGTTGIDGDPGDKGALGSPGLTGIPGESGIQGIDGYDGIQGNTGDNGTAGPKGPIGETGQPGPKGEPSKLWDDPSCSCMRSPFRTLFVEPF